MRKLFDVNIQKRILRYEIFGFLLRTNREAEDSVRGEWRSFDFAQDRLRLRTCPPKPLGVGRIEPFFLLLLFLQTPASENFEKKPQKKQPKLTVEQVCQNMMPENIISARINSLLGQNQATGLSWIDDIMEEAAQALFKLATQDLLQKFMEMEQRYIAALEQFELVLRERREFLKNWKQEVLAPKNKK